MFFVPIFGAYTTHSPISNEGVSTAREARPGGTAIFGFEEIGQLSDEAVGHIRGRG